VRSGLAFALTCVVGLVLGTAACSGQHATPAVHAEQPHAEQPVAVQVSLSHCGEGWSAGSSGWQVFDVRNMDSRTAEVTLVDPATGAVYASIEPLGAGRSAALSVELGPGHYAFRCALEDEDVITGPGVDVRGSLPPGTHLPVPVRPVTQADLLGPTRAYTAYVAGRLPRLTTEVARLAADVRRGERPAAERDWLVAHLDYERLGAAYGAFGEADGAVNGLPSGLPGGVRNKNFTGFHRVELDLWHGASMSRLSHDMTRLQLDLAGLRKIFGTAQIDPLEVSIRAHEIAENAVQLELTGRTEFGSGSSLATIRANLDGTRTVVGLLAPLLRPRYAGLGAALTTLDRAETDLDRLHTRTGWTALQSLSRASRERVDSDLSQLTELLAPIASICEPRRTS
jgi:iron uptake system component EfeO